MKCLPGHTLFLGVQAQAFPPGGGRLTLECACGTVLHSGLFVVDDPLHRETIRRDGRAFYPAHVRAFTDEPEGHGGPNPS